MIFVTKVNFSNLLFNIFFSKIFQKPCSKNFFEKKSREKKFEKKCKKKFVPNEKEILYWFHSTFWNVVSLQSSISSTEYSLWFFKFGFLKLGSVETQFYFLIIIICAISQYINTLLLIKMWQKGRAHTKKIIVT